MQIVRAYIRDRISEQDCGHRTPCWVWERCDRDGYGRSRLGNRTYQAHRVSYEAFVGPIPDGLEIDHLCCVTNCVNPEHLEPVTREENLRRKHVRRGYVIGGKLRQPVKREKRERRPRERGTHCMRGHERNFENTYIAPNGDRCCRVCERLRWPAKRARRLKREKARVEGLGGGRTEILTRTFNTCNHEDTLKASPWKGM